VVARAEPLDCCAYVFEAIGGIHVIPIFGGKKARVKHESKSLALARGVKIAAHEAQPRLRQQQDGGIRERRQVRRSGPAFRSRAIPLALGGLERPAYQVLVEKKLINEQQLHDIVHERNNIVAEIRMVLEVRK
jgi:hypothetical protein